MLVDIVGARIARPLLSDTLNQIAIIAKNNQYIQLMRLGGDKVIALSFPEWSNKPERPIRGTGQGV